MIGTLRRELKLFYEDSPQRVRIRMARTMISVLYVVAMIVVIVALDTLIFRNFFRERLIVNIGIVLVFAAFYLRFFKPS